MEELQVFGTVTLVFSQLPLLLLPTTSNELLGLSKLLPTNDEELVYRVEEINIIMYLGKHYTLIEII